MNPEIERIAVLQRQLKRGEESIVDAISIYSAIRAIEAAGYAVVPCRLTPLMMQRGADTNANTDMRSDIAYGISVNDAVDIYEGIIAARPKLIES